MTIVSGAAVLVTGGQRGLGKEILQELPRAGAAGDVSIVVNSAGVMTFAPVLAANDGDALVSLHSPTEWIAGFSGTGTYGAKNDPCVVAADIVAALEDRESELIADDASRHFEAALAGPVDALNVAS